MAFQYSLEIKAGATFRQQFEWRDGAEAVNLTGWTALMHVRDTNDTLLLSLSTENGGIVLGGTDGTINLFISATDTANLGFTSAAWDLSLRDPSGEIYPPLIEGRAIKTIMVTRWP